jgi:diguanylate cyclase (GGDEF)-like protein/PAS domain S-box-containing protein
VELMLENQVLVLGALVLLLLFVAALFWSLARRSARDEVVRLQDDLHALFSVGSLEDRLPVNGRPGAFVDIAASINRLLDRTQEQVEAETEGNAVFEDLASALPEIAVVHTSEILYANSAAESLLGVESGALAGKPLTDLLRPAYRAMMRKHITEQLDSEEPEAAPIEVQLISGDERGLWVELHTRKTAFQNEPALVSVAKDISHRKSMEASLGRGKLQARVTLESIGEGIITTDTAGTIDYMNEAAEHLIGTSRGAAIGKRMMDLFALVDEIDRESLGDPVAQCLEERRRVSFGRRAFLLSKHSEREFSVELTASPIRGPEGEIAGCVTIFHDVSELRGLAREMSYQASHDALTGLVNRVEFERRLESALESARSDDTTHVVSYLDLDRFKIVNDSSGHVAGDDLLREISVLLKNQVRDSDTVARVGGDEFAMLLTGCPLDKARQIADDVVEAVANYHFAWQDQVFDIGVSVGLVEIGPESGSAETVMNAADSACYVAKQQGRGRHHVYSARDEILAREKGEIHWLQRLQSALKEGAFELYVQPIVAIKGRVESGPAAEILLRMRDEGGKKIQPIQFIGAAERYQLMTHIDRWVVQSVLTTMSSGLPHLPNSRSCSINLSGQTLVDDTFLEFVVEVLDHTGVDPSRLCFEVSESAVVNNFDHARRFINVLHGIGCRFALDNFGSGVGSFANLKNLSLDYLKIDGIYTRDLDVDGVNREMISALIKLARRLDFLVIAEQIEDASSFEVVRELGVDFVQGFAVERPRPLGSGR